MKNEAPKRFIQFNEKYPHIADAYSALGFSVHQSGPLDEKTRALIKVAISGGARMEGAFHSHVKKARMVGVTREEMEHVVLITLPTLGFPHMMTLMTWLDDVYKKDTE